jgi:uncharacterized protein
MNPIIEAKKPEIIALCRQYGVSKLDLFGSATGPDWNTDGSDFDFVVEFADYRNRILHRFLAFAEAMEELLGRPADFVFEDGLKPRFRDYIEAQREAVYETSDRTVAA